MCIWEICSSFLLRSTVFLRARPDSSQEFQEMRWRRSTVAGWLFFAATAAAQNASPAPLPTWQEEIAKGFVPYHQVMVDDFAVNDHAPAEGAFRIKTFIHPYFHFLLKPYNGFVHGYIIKWVVFSGLDKNESSRKSSFREMKDELPYAQVFLDLSELHARKLAAYKTGELPQSHSGSFEEAQSELERKMKEFCQKEYSQVEAEMAAFEKATNNGQNKKKVRELARDLKKRLEASTAVATPSTPPTPAAAPSPAATNVPPRN